MTLGIFRVGAYGEIALGQAFQTAARLVRSSLGLRVATVDYGGWDTHQNQTDTFTNQVKEMSAACAAFTNDMRAAKLPVTLVVMSEFGRRVKSNESTGTDHGHGKWPGLSTEALDDGADLSITTDYRAVLCDVLASRVGVSRPHDLFPNYPEAPLLNIA